MNSNKGKDYLFKPFDSITIPEEGIYKVTFQSEKSRAGATGVYILNNRNIITFPIPSWLRVVTNEGYFKSYKDDLFEFGITGFGADSISLSNGILHIKKIGEIELKKAYTDKNGTEYFTKINPTNETSIDIFRRC